MCSIAERKRMTNEEIESHVFNPESHHQKKTHVQIAVDGCGGLILPEKELPTFMESFNSENYGLGESVEIKLTFIEMTDFEYSNLPEFSGF